MTTKNTKNSGAGYLPDWDDDRTKSPRFSATSTGEIPALAMGQFGNPFTLSAIFRFRND